MCVIIGLTKGQTFPYDKLKNASLNNPHGFGIVTVTDKKLSVYHKFDEKGNDPDLVAKQLEQRKDADMTWLHLRYGTKGDKDRNNTHPFTAYNEGGNRVEFMHNGSLSKWGTAGDTTRSDSRMFNENLLVPLLKRFGGDTEDIVLYGLLEEYFSYSNRGILIHNDLDPMFLGKWETFSVDGSKVIVSNNDYFDKTNDWRCTDFYKPKSLPAIQHQQPKQTHFPWQGHGHGGSSFSKEDNQNVSHPFGTAKMETAIVTPAASTMPRSAPTPKEQGTSTTILSTEKKKRYRMGRELTELKDVDLSKTGRFLTGADINGLYDTNGGDLDDELIGYLSMLSLKEFMAYCVNSPVNAARLLEHIFIRADKLIMENEKLEDDKLRAGHTIINLKKQLGIIQ